jgi:hypothetical protein
MPLFVCISDTVSLPTFLGISSQPALDATSTSNFGTAESSSCSMISSIRSTEHMLFDTSERRWGPLIVSLLDYSRPSASANAECVLASGLLCTETLLFEALKNCSGKPWPIRRKLPVSLCGSDSIPLLTLDLEVSCVVTSVSPAFFVSVKGAQDPSSVDEGLLVRAEAGLKQAFVSADLDNSGNISSDEVSHKLYPSY